MSTDFGRLLKAYRLSAGYGLRRFAEMIGELPSNYAAIEAGRRGAWKPTERLRSVADALALPEGSREWDRFFLAARDNRLPPDLEDLMARPLIPVLMRTVKDLSDDELQEFIEYLRKDRGVKHEDAGTS